MTIPDFQTIMLPLLNIAGDEREHYIHDAVNELAQYFQLSEQDKTTLLPSGQQPVFYNRVGWARTYLKKAGLLEDPKRGYFLITARGKDVLASNPERIDMKFLRQYPEYIEFRQPTEDINQGFESVPCFNKQGVQGVIFIRIVFKGVAKANSSILYYVPLWIYLWQIS